MKKGILSILFALLLSISLVPVSYSAPIITFDVQSEPGAFIGQGMNYSFSSPNIVNYLQFLADETGDGLVDNIFIGLAIPPDPQLPLSVLQIIGNISFRTSPLGINLSPGHYTGAQKIFFEEPDHPGFDFDYEGRGADTLIADFDIYELVIDYTGISPVLDALAINFTLQDTTVRSIDGSINDASVFGQLRINSDVAQFPNQIPEPSIIALFILGLTGLAFVRRRV